MSHTYNVLYIVVYIVVYFVVYIVAYIVVYIVVYFVVNVYEPTNILQFAFTSNSPSFPVLWYVGASLILQYNN